MTKLRVLLVLVAIIPAACVELSTAGARIRILKEISTTELEKCQSLGQVSVTSEDALRNAAAAMSGDTALMTVRDAGGSFYIRGTVYRCTGEAPVTISSPAAVPPVNEADTARKSAKCMDKGGAWNGYQCIIEID